MGFRRFAAIAVLMCGCVCPAGASIVPLCGIWDGTWFVQEKFDSSGHRYGSPPYPCANVHLVLHEYDLVAGDFGVVTFPGSTAIEGIIHSATFDGTNVALSIYYPGEGGMSDQGTLIGTVSGTHLTGSYIESVPPAGWIHWRGNVELTTVPEPATLAPLAVGSLLLLNRKAKPSTNFS